MDGCRDLMKSFNYIWSYLLQKFKYCDNVFVKLSCLLLEDDICYYYFFFITYLLSFLKYFQEVDITFSKQVLRKYYSKIDTLSLYVINILILMILALNDMHSLVHGFTLLQIETLS